MKNRLRRNEKEAIRSEWGENPIYRVLLTPCRELEKELGRLRLSAEEVFHETLRTLDEVKENPKDAAFVLQSFWDDIYCDLRDTDINDAPEEELQLAASEVVYAVMLMLSMLKGSVYTKLTMELMSKIMGNGSHFDHLQELFMPNLWRYGEEKLKDYLEAYMESEEEWISDDINDHLSALPKLSNEGAKEKEPSKNNEQSQLSNRQLILLFENFMNVPLTPEYTNINALAKLISHVSGRSQGSIRQKIREGFDYDSEAVKEDVRLLADLIEPISHEKAESLRKNIE